MVLAEESQQATPCSLFRNSFGILSRVDSWSVHLLILFTIGQFYVAMTNNPSPKYYWSITRAVLGSEICRIILSAPLAGLVNIGRLRGYNPVWYTYRYEPLPLPPQIHKLPEQAVCPVQGGLQCHCSDMYEDMLPGSQAALRQYLRQVSWLSIRWSSVNGDELTHTELPFRPS
jgi:hypothetical protein